MSERVLLVDDEPRLLDGLRRTLRGRYLVVTAGSGAEGLDLLARSKEEGDPIPVVISDMLMPGMNGADFLAKARELDPDVVAMILSGQADLTSTIAAVNNANLFRFLTKPIDADELSRALDAALRQAQLIRSEKELLAKTLGGAVDVLTEVLSMASPQASRRTARMRAVVASVAQALDLTDDWRLPIAAMLSQVGCLAVPGPVLDKLDSGAELSDLEQEMLAGHPATGRRLLERIPRLDEVARWVGAQPVSAGEIRSGAAFAGRPELPYDQSAHPVVEPADVVLAVSSMLTVVDSGDVVEHAAHELVRWFPRALLEAATAAIRELVPRGYPKEVGARQLLPGMVLIEDCLASNGMVLMRKGERVSDVLAERIANFARSIGVAEPIKVLDHRP